MKERSLKNILLADAFLIFQFECRWLEEKNSP